MTPQRANAIERIVKSEKYKHKFRQLTMTGQSDFCQHFDSGEFTEILGLQAFLLLQDLYLNKCKLDILPRFESLEYLCVLDISDNKLITLPEFRHKNLKQLRIEGNPIPKIVINPDNFPKLELISLGSNCTEIIGGKLLERSATHESKLCLEVDPLYRDTLTVPLLIDLYTQTVNLGPLHLSSEDTLGTPTDLPVSSFSPSKRMSQYSSRMSIAAPSNITAVSKFTSKTKSSRWSFSRRSIKKSKSIVLSTRTLVEKTLDVSLYFKKVKEEMNFGSIQNVQSRYTAMIYVLEEVNESAKLSALKLTSQSDLLDYLGPNEFRKFLKHRGLLKLELLDMNNCKLSKIPDLSFLTELTHLYLSDNNIAKIDEAIVMLVNLTHLDISSNPITSVGDSLCKCSKLTTLNIEETNVQTLDINFLGGNLGSLWSLQCGSKYLKYISHQTLGGMILNTFEIKVHEDYREKLVLPPHEILNKEQLIKEFLQNQNLSDMLRHLETHDNDVYFDALLHLVKQNDPRYVVLNFSGRILSLERIQTVLDYSSLESLTQLNLRGMNLGAIPNFTSLGTLKHLNISNNSITSLAGLDSRSLESLEVEENLFETLDFDPKKVASLKTVKFGSENCQFVSFTILSVVIKREIKLELSDLGKDHLLIPPPNVLADLDHLQEYVKCIEMSLRLCNTFESEQQMKCMLWLIENNPVEYKALDLSGEVKFCKSIGMENIELLMSKLKTIERLGLANCQLPKIPCMRNLEKLENINLKGNNIEIVDLNNDFNECTADIDLQDNPIPGFDLSEGYLPNLKRLSAGSEETKYFSLGILKKILIGSFEIQIFRSLSRIYYLP